VTNKQLGHCLVYSKKEKDARVKIMLVSNPSDIPTLLPKQRQWFRKQLEAYSED